MACILKTSHGQKAAWKEIESRAERSGDHQRKARWGLWTECHLYQADRGRDENAQPPGICNSLQGAERIPRLRGGFQAWPCLLYRLLQYTAPTSYLEKSDAMPGWRCVHEWQIMNPYPSDTAGVQIPPITRFAFWFCPVCIYWVT